MFLMSAENKKKEVFSPYRERMSWKEADNDVGRRVSLNRDQWVAQARVTMRRRARLQ
jgi:hypothetical protein